MDIIFSLALTSFLGGFIGAGVILALMPRQIAVRDVEASAELTSAMNELAGELVKVKMRSVRAAVKDAAQTPSAPPAAASNGTPVILKDQLRAVLRARQQGAI